MGTLLEAHAWCRRWALGSSSRWDHLGALQQPSEGQQLMHWEQGWC